MWEDFTDLFNGGEEIFLRGPQRSHFVRSKSPRLYNILVNREAPRNRPVDTMKWREVQSPTIKCNSGQASNRTYRPQVRAVLAFCI